MKKIICLVFIIYFSLSAFYTPVQAQNYDVSWWTIDGGGGTSTGGSYALSGTIGQPEAGVMNGGSYTLAGGFWGLELLRMVYLPLILRQ